MSLTIVKHGLYLDRIAREVGIVQDRGERQTWRYLTTRGYYVMSNGMATMNRGGESNEDLVKDVTPTIDQVHAADSMFGCLPS